MERNLKLQVGEKYLSVSLFGQINVAVFPNKNKANPQDPDFVGNGIAVWVKEKKSEQPQQIKQSL